jgi:hypothetical protein
MGVFWSSQTFNTNPDGSKGEKRDPVCKAKAQASFQVLAAILNSRSPKGASLPMDISTIRTTMGGNDEAAIKNLIDIMSAHNTSGEGLPLGLPENCMGHADPGAAQSMANEAFANCR